jgi:chorismate mutase
MAINLDEIRYKRDRLTSIIVSGLNDRSRYKLNQTIFTETFGNTKKTWFQYRLLMEQNLDAQFGRFKFSDQQPILFSPDELDKPMTNITPPATDVKPFSSPEGISIKIMDLYRSILPEICKEGEDRSQYGETVKCDVSNILLYNERVIGIGKFVAESKIQRDPSILSAETDKEIREKLVVKSIEDRVVADARCFAEACKLNPDRIESFFRDMMSLTVDIEGRYIRDRIMYL